MEDQSQTHVALRHRNHHHRQEQQQLTVKTILFATVAGVTIGGPLLGLMAFSFITTMTLFVITSPLLIIFSPLLMVATFILAATLLGLGAAGVLAIAGVALLSWAFRSVKTDGLKGLNLTEKLVESGEKLKEKVVESGEKVMDTGKDGGNHRKQAVENSSEDIIVTGDSDDDNVKDTGKDWASGSHRKQPVENSPEKNKKAKVTGKDHLKQPVENSTEKNQK